MDMSGNTLEEIVTSVKKVSDIVAEIAAASQEQSSGIEQVNKAVMQLDQVTQQNAALVEEAAAASESMDEQARGLRELMNFFKVGDHAEVMEPQVMRRAAASAKAQRQPSNNSEVKPKQSRIKKEKPAKREGDEDWEEF